MNGGGGGGSISTRGFVTGGPNLQGVQICCNTTVLWQDFHVPVVYIEYYIY